MIQQKHIKVNQNVYLNKQKTISLLHHLLAYSKKYAILDKRFLEKTRTNERKKKIENISNR